MTLPTSKAGDMTHQINKTNITVKACESIDTIFTSLF